MKVESVDRLRGQCSSSFHEVGSQVWQRAGTDGTQRDHYFVRIMALNTAWPKKPFWRLAENPNELKPGDVELVRHLLFRAARLVRKRLEKVSPERVS